MNKIGLSFLPSTLKELLKNIPSAAYHCADWKGLLLELKPLVQSLTKEFPKDQLASLEIYSPIPVSFEKTQGSPATKKQGELVLELYFSQLFNPKGLVIDLRQHHFGVLENAELTWSPSKLWYRFDDSFRLSLIKLYRSFYKGESAAFESALDEMGLTTGLNSVRKKELAALFKTHFGEGGQGEIHFELASFQESFINLFEFFATNKVFLFKDFVFLGVYLVSLYMNLDHISEPLNVRSAFEVALERFDH